MAVIKSAVISNNRIFGNVYGDKRFLEGGYIMTSEIKERWDKNGKHYVQTQNTIYEVEYKEER